MMNLRFEYVLDGKKKGYTLFYDGSIKEHIEKEIWQKALPQGIGWNHPQYQNLRILKCFQLSNGQFAASDVQVTDTVDHLGRQGIMRSDISLIDTADFIPYLKQRLENIPAEVRHKANSRINQPLWNIIFRALKSRGSITSNKYQILLAYDSSSVNSILMEAYVIQGIIGLLSEKKRHRRIIDFTTFALDYKREAFIVGVPLNKVPPAFTISSVGLSIIPLQVQFFA